MQNNVQILGKWSKSKVNFQYGGRLFFKNGTCRRNLGLLIDFDLLKAMTSANTKQELVFSGRGRHLEKWK